MNNPFLLIVGENYYPGAGTRDWKGRYESYEEALDQIKIINHPERFHLTPKGNKKVDCHSYDSYQLTDGEYEFNYDWYEIVDLETWTK